MKRCEEQRAHEDNKMKDGAIVVLYNPRDSDFVNICDYAGRVTYTLIIDNSQKSHLPELEKRIHVDGDSIVYLHFPENVGLCRAMNLGMKQLHDLGCTWVLQMNSDSFFNNNILEIYREYIRSHDCRKVAALAPVYNTDRKKGQQTGRIRKLKRNMMSGSYMNTEVFAQLKGYQEILFVEGLDNEYCIRAQKRGYAFIECGDAVLNHIPGETREFHILGRTLLRYGYHSPQRYYAQARSLVWIVMKHKTLYEFAFYCYKLLKIIFLFDHKRDFLLQYMRGTRDGFKLARKTDVEEL